MVVRNMKGKKGLFFIIIVALILMLIFKDTIAMAYCEMSDEEAMAALKQIAYEELLNNIKNGFYNDHSRYTSFYINIILNEGFVANFIETVQWNTFFDETRYWSVDEKFAKIDELFKSYISKIRSESWANYNQKKELAYKNSISFFINFVGQCINYVQNVNYVQNINYVLKYTPIIPWSILALVISDMLITTVPTNLPLIIETVQPLIDFAHILSVYKQLHIPNVIPNAIILGPPNVKSYYITTGAWESFFNSLEWRQIVINNHTILFGFTFFISIVIVSSIS